MKRILILLTVGVISIIFGVSAALATTDSITLDQSNPTWGQNLTFTAVFTKAENKQWPPRIYNPTLAVVCDNGFHDAALKYGKLTNLGNGYLSSEFGYIVLQGSGTSNCIAYLEFTDGNGNTAILSSTSFIVQ